MSNPNRSKLNLLIRNWHRGTVTVSPWLISQGYSKNLIYRYIQSKWIEPIGRGAYKLYTDTIDWEGGVFALQERMKLPIHVGGKTSFQLRGYGHFINQKIPDVFLFGEEATKLPLWFKNFDWKAKINYTSTTLFRNNPDLGLMTENIGNQFSITISSLERASMELMYFLPHNQAYDEVTLLF